MMHKTTRFLPFLLVAACALCTCSAHATTYYWIGGASGEWANGSNWSLTDGGEAANAYPSDYSVDEATVAAAATITLPSSNANVSNLYVNANVSLTGGKIHAKTISGSGKLTMLNGTSFYASGSSTVSADVEIPAGATVNVDTSTSYAGFTFAAECALTGSGTIEFKGYRPSHPLYWDASGFSGTVVVVDDNVPRNNTTIRSTTATHEGMTWQVANSGAGDTGFITQEGTYKFGSLSGTVYMANSKSSSAYAYVKDVTMEIGALNGDDVLGGQIARTAGRANDGAYIRKVGTGVLSSSVKGVNGYYIKEGVLNIASDDGLSVKDDSGNPGTDIVFEGGVLRLAEGVTKDASAYIAIGTSTSPVAFDDEGRDHVWNKALGSSLTGGLTKKGSGTLTLAAAPAYTGTTTIEGGVLVVPQGTTIAELSCEGGKLAVPLTGTEDETEVLTISSLADGTTYDSVTSAVAVVGATMSVVADGEGVYKVKATRTPQTFTWTGAVDTDWATPGNWTVGGEVPVAAPIAIDSANFPADASIALGGNHSISNISIAAAATVSISGGMLAGITEFGSESAKGGALVLSGASLESASIAGGSYLSWYGDIEIAGDASVTNYIHCRNLDNSSNTSAVRLYGNLTGTGNLCLDRTGHTSGGVYDGRGGVSLYGDNEAFSGVCIIHSGSSTRGPATFCSATAGSSLARWIYPDSVAQNESARAGTSTINGGTIKLGTYEGKSYFFACESGHDNNVIEIGGKGVDFACSLSAKCRTNADRGNINTTLRKVGAGTMTFGNELGQPYMAKWDLAGGILHLANPNISKFDGGYGGGTKITPEFNFSGGALSLDESCTNQTDESLIDLSAYVKNSTNAIDIIVSEGQSLTWATELADTNVGGLTKKGAGTLTLTAVPLYTGLTTVEEGALVLPSDFDIVFNPFSAGTLSGVTPTRFAYPVNTTLTGSETWKSFEGTLDIANVTAIDVSAATLTKGQPYVIASATAINGYTKESLAQVARTLPDGVDSSKWVLKVLTIDNARCLCVAPKTNPFVILVR